MLPFSLPLSLSLSLSVYLPFCLSHFLRKSNVESPGVLKGKKLVHRRRNTCPSPQDITRALQSPSSAPSASAASLDDLIQRCLNCFGQSLFAMWFYTLTTTRLYNWGMRESVGGGGERNWQGGMERDKEQSHTIKLCSVGLQKPACHSHAMLNYTNLSISISIASSVGVSASSLKLHKYMFWYQIKIRCRSC